MRCGSVLPGVILVSAACGVADGPTRPVYPQNRAGDGDSPPGADADPPAAACDPECTIGEARCEAELVVHCVEGPRPGCGVWGPAQPCPELGTCRAKACVEPCSDAEVQICADEGICSQGTRGCVDGYFGFCDWVFGPEAESCNGLDDDCDGVVDNPRFMPCPEQDGVCAGARERCANGAPTCDNQAYALAASFHDGTYEVGGEESCDGLDNDCDGAVDEMTATDPRNCGWCGHDCGALVCIFGECACQQDSQCPGGEICDGGACRPGCRHQTDCPSDQYCDMTLVCRPGCRDDSGCPIEHICSSHTCISGCSVDAHCNVGRICDGDQCRPGCRDDTWCTTGQICEGTDCQAGCRDDSACGAHEICDQTTCRAGCRFDSDCGDSEICDATTCRAGCREDAACPLEHVCVETVCVEGCAPPGADRSASDETRCPVGHVCQPSNCHYDDFYGHEECEYFACQTLCSSGWPCPGEDWTCYGDHCQQMCASDSDCSDGNTCQWFRLSAYSTGGSQLCAPPCTEQLCDNDAATYAGDYHRCTCAGDGQCVVGTTRCYRTDL